MVTLDDIKKMRKALYEEKEAKDRICFVTPEEARSWEIELDIPIGDGTKLNNVEFRIIKDKGFEEWARATVRNVIAPK